MRLLRLLGLGALALTAACAVEADAVLLDDAYDVPAGHIVELPVLANDYLPAPAVAEPFDAPDWVTGQEGGVVAAVPADWEDEVSFRYRAASGEASVTLRSVQVRARLDPPAGILPAGSEHGLEAQVERSIGGGPWQPLAGADVALLVDPDGATAGEPRCRTDAAGRCRVTLRRDDPGIAQVHIATLQTEDGITFEPRPAATAEVRWVAARVELSGDVTVPVGEEAEVAASVEVHDGTIWVAAQDTQVTFAVDGDGPLPDHGPVSCAAPCGLDLASDAPTTVTVGATARVSVGGVELLIPAPTPARVAWVEAQIEVRGGAVVPVGTDVVVTVAVGAHDGTREVPAAGVDVDLAVADHAGSRSSQPDTALECRTTADGTCRVTLGEDRPRTVLVTAAAGTVAVGGIDVAAVPADPGAGTAEIAWWAPALGITAPGRAAAGEDVTVTARVTVDDGVERVPAGDATVRFAARGADVRPSCPVRSAGSCSVPASRSRPGTARVTATATVTHGGRTATADDATTVTWFTATVTVTGGGTAVAGDPLGVTAAVAVDTGGGPEPEPDATVRLSGDRQCTTGGSGACTVTIESPGPGSETVSATRIEVGGARFPGSGSVSLRWVDAKLDLDVGYTSGPDDEQIAVLTVTASVHDGTDWAPSGGTEVAFSSRLGARRCATAADGTCEVSLNIPSPGGHTVAATAGFTVAGLPITRTAEGVAIGAGGTVEFVRAGLEFTPTRGTARSVEVLVRGNDGETRPQPGASVRITGPSGVTITGSPCTTGAGGRCEVTARSATAGKMELCAVATFQLRGWNVTTPPACDLFTWSPGLDDFVPPVPPDPPDPVG